MPIFSPGTQLRTAAAGYTGRVVQKELSSICSSSIGRQRAGAKYLPHKTKLHHHRSFGDIKKKKISKT